VLGVNFPPKTGSTGTAAAPRKLVILSCPHGQACPLSAHSSFSIRSNAPGGEPKSKKSKAHVPVISPLRKFLEQHRRRSGNPEAGIMFKTRNNTPVSMNNLLNDQILPVLNACERCGKLRAEHAGADHEYQTDR
jgi:hypothetical protein